MQHLASKKVPRSADVAYVEFVRGGTWTVHYRVFIEWGSRVVICDGKIEGFVTSDLAFEWLFGTLEGVAVVTRREYFGEQGAPRLQ